MASTHMQVLYLCESHIYNSYCVVPVLHTKRNKDIFQMWPSVAELPGFNQMRPSSRPLLMRFVGGEASIGMVSKLRRLHFEASTLVVAQLRTMVEGDTPDAPRKLPGAEKASRLQQVKKLLPGIVIEGDLEPSHALIDLVAHMGECNSIVWLPPSKCTKRDSELRLGFRDKPRFLTVQEQGVPFVTGPYCDINPLYLANTSCTYSCSGCSERCFVVGRP